jgi:hypothetical protein
MADNLVFEESLNTEVDTSEFISKKWIYVNDNNNGNYTSQIVIDSTPLSNAGGYINWSEGFIVMPLLIELSSTSANAATSIPPNSSHPDFAWAFKNGYWQMINSMTIEFNNQNIVQQTPFLNVFRSFKCLTSWSKDDLENHGATCGFYPDSSDSWSYHTAFNASNQFNSNGQNFVITNNRNTAVQSAVITGTTPATNNPLPPITSVAGIPVQAAGTDILYSGADNASGLYSSVSYNEGMAKRQKYVVYDPVASESLGQGTLNPSASCDSVYRNSKVVTDPAVGGCATYKVFAKLRLKDLADYFEKVPLLKGSTMRFYINTNQAMVNFSVTRAVVSATTSAVTTFGLLTPSVPNVVGGLTCPIMLASAQLGQGMSPLPQIAAGTALTDTYQLSVSIYKNNFNQTNKSGVSSPLTACRLYCPVYTMNPIAESKYLSLAPTKRVKYNDIFQYQFNDVGVGSFNFLVSNGINNIQSVLVVPFLSTRNGYTDSAGVVQTSLLCNQQLNPCSATPAMPDPFMLTNFNIMISGVNLFLNNENYDYEAFCTQLAQSNQINGGLTTGLASGLISEKMFSQGYRYYYGNCSRVLPSEEGVSRSVQIVGQNTSKASCDFMVFVEFQREIVIDVATGARIE